MSNVSSWSTTAGSNNSSPPNGWPEGMARSAVNDAAREMMAALAKWYKDGNASLVTAGTGNAYTLATNSVYTALGDIALLVFLTDRTNTGSVTLNVDGLGAKQWLKNTGGNFASGEVPANGIHVVAYNSIGDTFQTVGPPTGQFPSGTLMLFQQTAAPSGWTKQATHDNKALRVVTGTASSGGSTAFTSVFTSRTISQANLPSYNLSTGSLTGSVGTTITNGTNQAVVTGGTGTSGWTSGGTGGSVTVSLASGTVTFGGSIPSGGSGTAMDFAVQYVDLIIAAKT
jgi:hypothetical protein